MSASAPEPARPRVPEVLPEYCMSVAGRCWRVQQVAIDIGYDDRPVLPGRERKRITWSIANEVCASPSSLTPPEFEYLADLSANRYIDIARKLGVTRATVSHWLRKGKEVPLAQSLILKKWFWAQLFPKAITPSLTFTLEELLDDALVLQRLHAEAIRLGLAEALTSEPLPPSPPALSSPPALPSSPQTSSDVS